MWSSNDGIQVEVEVKENEEGKLIVELPTVIVEESGLEAGDVVLVGVDDGEISIHQK